MLQYLQDKRHIIGGFILNSQHNTGFKYIYQNSGNNNFEWQNIYCENLFSWIASLQLFYLEIFRHSVVKKSYDWSKISIRIQATIHGKYFSHSTLIFMY